MFPSLLFSSADAMLPWASICLDGLLASHPLQPFHFILHSVSLVIVLEMDLIIWLPNPDRTLQHCPTVQILYKMSVLHYCLLPTWSGLWVLYAHKNPHVILCSCVLSTFCLKDYSSAILTTLSHYYHSKFCLSFKSKFKWDQYFKAF